jgi:hypothetical protein
VHHLSIPLLPDLEPMTTDNLLNVSEVFPFPECHLIGIIQNVYRHFILASLFTNVHLSALMSFHYLKVHFFLLLDNNSIV